MSHYETSKRVFGVNLETIVNRISRTFVRASASDIEAGACWYDEATDIANTLAYNYGHEPAIMANVISALSPRTSWSRNVAAATALMASGPDAARALGAMGANVDRAVAALTGTPLKGPKIKAFAANMSGDTEAVTVDVWAMRVADLDEGLLGRKGAYEAIAHAYRLAARRHGVTPRTMQATTWVVARNGRAD